MLWLFKYRLKATQELRCRHPSLLNAARQASYALSFEYILKTTQELRCRHPSLLNTARQASYALAFQVQTQDHTGVASPSAFPLERRTSGSPYTHTHTHTHTVELRGSLTFSPHCPSCKQGRGASTVGGKTLIQACTHNAFQRCQHQKQN